MPVRVVAGDFLKPGPMCWQGTVVTAGRARCVVVGTGTSTAIGKIHDAMTDAVRL